MLSHVTIGVEDLAAAARFYEFTLAPLGVHVVHRDERYVGFSVGLETHSDRPHLPMLWICRPFDGEPAKPGNGHHVALLARQRTLVDQVHQRALASGAVDEGSPGVRPEYHAMYYAAFFRDLDRNKLQVCFPGSPTACWPRVGGE